MDGNGFEIRNVLSHGGSDWLEGCHTALALSNMFFLLYYKLLKHSYPFPFKTPSQPK